jgi:hypothetical protein
MNLILGDFKRAAKIIHLMDQHGYCGLRAGSRKGDPWIFFIIKLSTCFLIFNLTVPSYLPGRINRSRFFLACF